MLFILTFFLYYYYYYYYKSFNKSLQLKRNNITVLKDTNVKKNNFLILK